MGQESRVPRLACPACGLEHPGELLVFDCGHIICQKCFPIGPTCSANQCPGCGSFSERDPPLLSTWDCEHDFLLPQPSSLASPEIAKYLGWSAHWLDIARREKDALTRQFAASLALLAANAHLVLEPTARAALVRKYRALGVQGRLAALPGVVSALVRAGHPEAHLFRAHLLALSGRLIQARAELDRHDFEDILPEVGDMHALLADGLTDARLFHSFYAQPDSAHHLRSVSAAGAGEVRLPRNTSFLTPFLAGSSIPTAPEQVQAFERALGVTLIVTLYETPLPRAFFAGTTVRNMWIRTENYEPPPNALVLVAAAREILAEAQRGGRILVHCGGGVGRAGTCLCACLGLLGLTPYAPLAPAPTPPPLKEALAHLRRLRPRSVETSRQKKALQQVFRALRDGAAPDLEATGAEVFPAPLTLPGRYPTTPHLPFSPAALAADDIRLPATAAAVFVGAPVVITEKLDGGNCCIFDGQVFARTHAHPTRLPWFSRVKQLARSLRVPRTLALFGENMSAVHSIEYPVLPHFFFLFAAFDAARAEFLSWDDTARLAARLGVPTVPVHFHGAVASPAALQRKIESAMARPSHLKGVSPEGFVVRLAAAFSLGQFERSIAKYVRADHIQTDASFRRAWKKANIVTRAPAAAPPRAVHKKTALPSAAPSFIVMCGLPGSGKSTFISLLNASGAWTVISQDDLGSRDACHAALSTALRKRERVVIDRVNPLSADRAEWARASGQKKGARGLVCVFVDVPPKHCRARLSMRLSHPTIQFGRGASIPLSVARSFQTPDASEGFGATHVVRTLEDMSALAVAWGGAATRIPVSAPRECHKISFAPLDRAPVDIALQLLPDVAPEQILLACVVGSRLWGTAQPDSDWDVIVVVSAQVSGFAALEAPRSRHSGVFDGTIYPDSLFRERVQHGRFLETLCCVLCAQGSPHAWTSLCARELPAVEFSERCVAAWEEETRRDAAYARKMWGAGKRRLAVDALVHAVRARAVICEAKRGARLRDIDVSPAVRFARLAADVHSFSALEDLFANHAGDAFRE
eukprot:gnl/Chilomastix_cuspidata/5924.p1 GENE.gnl/Chilomastix_cuspidata/5924~~gnl/Chilomastix_cuspidata/5924.p1  ORF type:complete len:1066 (+),score=314.62 gnl/Chilomastix_cuspidata/5924:74-3199(+)